MSFDSTGQQLVTASADGEIFQHPIIRGGGGVTASIAEIQVHTY